MEDIYVGIDIGSTKVCTLIGNINKAGQMEIHGRGVVPCKSIKKGNIIDIDTTSRAIKASIGQAEKESGYRIGSAYANISGLHVNVINHKESIEVSGENKVITKDDLEQLYDKIERISVPEGSQIIDIIPREYIVDGCDSIKDPLGMSGLSLEIDADIVVGKLIAVQNIVKSIEKAGLEVDGILTEAFSTSELLLTPEDKEIGAILIDIGGGITDISAFKNGNLQMYDSIPVGGEHITNDISIGLHISTSEAEKIKKQYELALTDLIKNDQDISIYDVNDETYKTIKISEVIEIIEARVVEIFSLSKELVDKYVDSSGFSSGIILTGGGISYVNGNRQITSAVFELPAKVASFKGYSNISNPEFAAAAGIIKYAAARNKNFCVIYSDAKKETEIRTKKEGIIKRFLKALKNGLF